MRIVIELDEAGAAARRSDGASPGVTVTGSAAEAVSGGEAPAGLGASPADLAATHDALDGGGAVAIGAITLPGEALDGGEAAAEG